MSGKYSREEAYILTAANLLLVLLMSSCAHIKGGPFEIGKGVKLGDCEHTECNFVFQKPRGGKYLRLVFTCSREEEGTSPLQGQVSLKVWTGDRYEYSFDRNTLTKCNWLHTDYPLNGYVLDWPNVLDDHITAKTPHELSLTFIQQPQEGVSLWLYYIPWYYLLTP